MSNPQAQGQQQQQQQQQPPPPPPPSVRLVKSLVNKPFTFNSNKKDYLEWKRKTQLFIFANTLHLKTNLDKVLCAVLYMGGERAGRWATAYVKTIMSTGTLPAGTDYAGFWTHADRMFLPPNTARNAANELDRLKQNNLPAEDFFIKFELLIAWAGYLDSKFDPIKMKIIEQNLQPRLVNKLYSQFKQPKDWDDFKEKVLRLDSLYQFRLRDKQQFWKTLPNVNHLPSFNRFPVHRDPNAMDIDATQIQQVSSPLSIPIEWPEITLPWWPQVLVFTARRRDIWKCSVSSWLVVKEFKVFVPLPAPTIFLLNPSLLIFGQ